MLYFCIYVKPDDGPHMLKHVEFVKKILYYSKYVVVLCSVGSQLISIKHSGMTFVKKGKTECVLRWYIPIDSTVTQHHNTINQATSFILFKAVGGIISSSTIRHPECINNGSLNIHQFKKVISTSQLKTSDIPQKLFLYLYRAFWLINVYYYTN